MSSTRDPRRLTPRRARQVLSGLAASSLLLALVACLPPRLGSAQATGDPSRGVVTLPTDPRLPRAADGRPYPVVPSSPDAIAGLLTAVEVALRSGTTPAADLAQLGHQQQVIYRTLAHRPDLATQVRAYLAPRWQLVLDQHMVARRAFLEMRRGKSLAVKVPAWRIIPPEPAANLLGYYYAAAAATGIPWEVLAAVNLVESGMGRIDGVSIADARGPMQFLPSTWAEAGIGKGGDIRNPQDSIHAAARYLVRRGGLKDIRKGLWGYNNSDQYGRAVLAYASLIREDPAAYTGLYHWEVHYPTVAGDLWLPVGYDQPRPLAVATFLQQSPASAPPTAMAGILISQQAKP